MEEHHHTEKKKKISTWKIISLILAVLLFISIFTSVFSLNKISKDKAKEISLKFINENLLVGQAAATITSIEDTGSLYKIKLNIQGKEYDSYITRDAKILFPTAIELTGTPAQDEQPIEDNQQVVEVSADDDPVKGSKDAPITIIEFSDFQCPYCGKVEPTIKQVLEAYEGKIKLIYRDFPLGFHEFAQKASEASECADEQGKYWEYHDKLFENQNDLTVEDLKKYATDLKLDTTKFNDCLDSEKYKSEVQKDFEDGQKYGVSGTPAFFINGISLVGAQPFSAFQQIIEQELNK